MLRVSGGRRRTGEELETWEAAPMWEVKRVEKE
jgi:hypothetical protein